MTPEQITKVRSILRLATHLPVDERDEYLAAVTAEDEEVRAAVDRLLRTDMSLEQTLRETPRPRPG